MSLKFNYITSGILFLSILLFSCSQGQKKEWEHYGYFGSAKYFDRNNVSPDYIEDFIIKIDTGFIKIYGTVQTWGREFKYGLSENKDTLLIEKQLKIYKKGESSICFEYSFNDSIYKEEFTTIPSLETVITSDGIDGKKLGLLLNKLQFAGTYTYQNKIVEFKQDGGTVNFDKFKRFNVRPRLGTLTYYKDRIIETENGIWEFEKSAGNLILTKYSENRDKNEMFLLTNEKAILQK